MNLAIIRNGNVFFAHIYQALFVRYVAFILVELEIKSLKQFLNGNLSHTVKMRWLFRGRLSHDCITLYSKT